MVAGRAFILAHRARPDGGQDLAAYPLDGGEPAPILERFTGVHTSFNRAGTHAVTDAFHYGEENRGAVLLYELDGGACEVLCTGSHADTEHTTGSHIHPQWSRAEDRIFFNMADAGFPRVYAVDLNG
ncbi:MAG: hypothetical protein ACOCX4_05245 [Planctomycetota bacterium]